MDKTLLTQKIKAYARQCGLDLVGITTPESFDDYIRQVTTNAAMYEPGYGKERVDKWCLMARPQDVMLNAKSVIVAGFYYLTTDKMDETASGKPCGRVARVMTHGHAGVYKRIVKLAEFLTQQGFQVKGGIHRKSAAVRAGLGFIGKHTLVINKEFGSWVAYQVLVTDAELDFDQPVAVENCGECRICLDRCPTQALYEPYKLDPRRCITYLLNQARIPMEFRDKIGNRILGCDLCQEVCPRNKKPVPKNDISSVMSDKLGLSPALLTLLSMDEETFRSEVLGKISQEFSQANAMFLEEMVPSTFQKAGGKIMVYMRNVVLALGNIGDPVAIPYLVRLLKFPMPDIRSIAAWSLGKIGTSASKQALASALPEEPDPEVKLEMDSALKRIGEN